MAFAVSFYETLLDNLHDGIWVSDEQDQIFYANSGVEILLEIANSDFINNKVDEFIFSAKDPSFIDTFQEAKTSLKSIEFITEYKYHDIIKMKMKA